MACRVALFKHQIKTTNFVNARPAAFDASDPGTGKTIGNLNAFNERVREGRAQRMLVLCPKTIMELAWGRDIETAFPHLTYALAGADNRERPFLSNARIVIMNHDGVVWLRRNMHLLEDFTDLLIDESTAFKNRTAGRSRAIQDIALKKDWTTKIMLSGTPMPLSVTDIWHQVFLLDGGQRLGKNFYAFQSACCSFERSGPGPNHGRWVDKEGINDVVVTLLEDIMIRHKLEDCIDIPPNHVINLPVRLNEQHRRKYESLLRDAVLQYESGELTTFNSGALRTKLLQLLSGAVYDKNDGSYVLLDTDRYNLVLDLVEQRSASLVAFMWTHQRDEIARLANARGLDFAIIDGETSRIDRVRIIDAFQRGELKFVLGHPKTMSHGVTMTRGTATIWPSPTDNAEHFVQMNRRVYRNGQTAPTETILIAGEGTLEERVYDRLLGKVSRQADLLELLASLDDSTEQPHNLTTLLEP